MTEEYNSLLDEEELDRELLTEAISPYLKIGKKSGDIIWDDSLEDVTQKNKVIIFLLARKAVNDLGKGSSRATPGEISDETGVNSNTVRSVLKRLKSSGLVKDRGANYYEIPNYTLEEVVEELD